MWLAPALQQALAWWLLRPQRLGLLAPARAPVALRGLEEVEVAVVVVQAAAPAVWPGPPAQGRVQARVAVTGLGLRAPRRLPGVRPWHSG